MNDRMLNYAIGVAAALLVCAFFTLLTVLWIRTAPAEAIAAPTPAQEEELPQWVGEGDETIIYDSKYPGPVIFNMVAGPGLISFNLYDNQGNLIKVLGWDYDPNRETNYEAQQIQNLNEGRYFVQIEGKGTWGIQVDRQD